MSREVRLELLIGTPVHAQEGGVIGRIEEVRAGDHQEITEFLVGEAALAERLSALGLFSHKKHGYRVRWDQLDWSDLRRPMLTCPVDDLAPI
jgi:hypothetical protein